jgi:ribosomal protein S18 acetylase RimI-like enzyme
MLKSPLAHVTIRRARHSDRAFVAHTLQCNLRRCNRALVSQLVGEHLDDTLIVCVPSDEDVALGFLIAEPHKLLIYYCYIKAAFRRMGLARALYEHAFPDTQAKRYALQHNKHEDVKPLIAKLRLDYEPIAAMVKEFQ